MKSVEVESCSSFELVLNSLPGDKSISHRVAMFSLFANSVCKARNFLMAEDTLNSLEIAKSLGAKVEWINDELFITPPQEIVEPSDILDCGNAGTGMRLYCGLLASIDGLFVLSGDKYLNSRPMKRVIEPLNSIGANIFGRENNTKAPIVIRGGKLRSFKYELPVASAQVKSALILAALRADNVCEIIENELTRDHTEKMFIGMGANIKKEKNSIFVEPIKEKLNSFDLNVPSDPSSAFFFAVAAAIVPNSSVTLKNLTINQTRIEAFKILEKMGANVSIVETENIYEPIGDITISYNKLNGVIVEDNISWLIDEIPALAIAMAVANGKSIVKNAQELRKKESDRISSVVINLQKCGISIIENNDGFEIAGDGIFNKTTVDSFGDHRIAMSFSIAALISNEKISIDDIDCINTSFPQFFEILSKITSFNLRS